MRDIVKQADRLVATRLRYSINTYFEDQALQHRRLPAPPPAC
jgi:hypothetical protein